jgi:molybdopterin converting factor small subunit
MEKANSEPLEVRLDARSQGSSVRVRVQFFASVRELVGSREETVELPDQSTVRALLDSLVKGHGERLRDYLYDPKTGEVRRSIQLLIGDRPVPTIDGTSTVLPAECIFAIIPPVGGG